MTAPEPAEPIRWEPEHRALMLQTFIGEAEKALAAITKGLKVAYPLPRTIPFESPLDGASLGYVQRARKEPEWVVTAPQQLEEHFTTDHPGAMETVYDLDVPGVAEPVALPENHPITQALLHAAPDLLTPRRRVPADVIVAALRESELNGTAAEPGIQLVRRGQGNLNVVYDKKSAPAAIGRLFRSGRVDLAELGVDIAGGRPVLDAHTETEREAS